MKFFIVTPCWNSSGLIGDTVRSICQQTALADPDVTLEYVVVDGASTDATVEEVQASWAPSPQSSLTIISEPDRGMYDALVKGLRGASGDVVAYINAGDYYSPHCLAVVKTCFELPGVTWLTGMRTLYNSDGVLIASRLPYKYDRKLMRSGHYGVRGGRFLQQESTFWSRDLLNTTDLDRLSEMRLAGDLFLWTQFARSADLDIVSAHLGGFRFHGGHLSDAMDEYLLEARGFLARPRVGGAVRGSIHEMLSWLPSSRRWMVPGTHPIIEWNRESDSWVSGRAVPRGSGHTRGAIASTAPE